MLPHTRNRLWSSRRRPLAALAGALATVLSGAGGCALPWPPDVNSLVEGLFQQTQSHIVASVTETAETGLPLALSGTLSGPFEGTYEETVLEVYFDSQGAPVAAISQSQFHLDAPAQGTLTSLNLIVVTDTILLTDRNGAPVLDEQGAPILSGLNTAATGEIVHGSGAFAGVAGELHTDSVLVFGGGDFGAGSLRADILFALNTDGIE